MIKDFFNGFGILFRRFLLSSHTVTRAPPHVRDANNVQRLWNYFVIASLPSWLIGLWSLGRQTNLAIADFALASASILSASWLAWRTARCISCRSS